jgi:hypothetical protein
LSIREGKQAAVARFPTPIGQNKKKEKEKKMFDESRRQRSMT